MGSRRSTCESISIVVVVDRMSTKSEEAVHIAQYTRTPLFPSSLSFWSRRPSALMSLSALIAILVHPCL